MSEDQSERPRRLHIGAAADRRLAELGLRADQLRNAVSRGDEMRRRCSPLHPKTFGGQVMWAETVEALRRQVIPGPGDWAPGSSGNYETAFSIERGIAIAVVGGDANTGVIGFHDPCVRRRRGPRTRQRVQRNRAAQAPLPLAEFERDDIPDDERVVTWFLLVHAREERLYQELSLPVVMEEDSTFTTWAERILLEPLDGVGAITPTPATDDSGEVPSVNVSRRG